MLTIGILGFQGAIREHVRILNEIRFGQDKDLGDFTIEVVKRASEVERCDGLIIPGGESTVMANFMGRTKVAEVIKEIAKTGVPIMGTCAGLILLAKKTYDRIVGTIDQLTLDILDVTVQRNAFGMQRESFEANVDFSNIGIQSYPCVFIRAPVIDSVNGSTQVLGKFQDKIVAAESGNILGLCFHPELTKDTRFHEHFMKKISK